MTEGQYKYEVTESVVACTEFAQVWARWESHDERESAHKTTLLAQELSPNDYH